MPLFVSNLTVKTIEFIKSNYSIQVVTFPFLLFKLYVYFFIWGYEELKKLFINILAPDRAELMLYGFVGVREPVLDEVRPGTEHLAGQGTGRRGGGEAGGEAAPSTSQASFP